MSLQVIAEISDYICGHWPSTQYGTPESCDNPKSCRYSASRMNPNVGKALTARNRGILACMTRMTSGLFT